jgi:hypothetical protein
MKIITPLVLFGMGVVLLVLAVVLYRSAATTEVPAPAVPLVTFTSNVAIANIDYLVTQASPGTTLVVIGMQRDPSGRVPLFKPTVYVTFAQDVSRRGVTRTVTFGHSGSASAVVHFYVHEADFGMSFNGSAASAAIPRIGYVGPGTPLVAVRYPIPSASSYDWSSFPTADVTSSYADWETITAKTPIGVEAEASTPGQVAVGINHARQATDSDKTFAAGALLGLAGGAILSAVQEALHARD